MYKAVLMCKNRYAEWELKQTVTNIHTTKYIYIFFLIMMPWCEVQQTAAQKAF